MDFAKKIVLNILVAFYQPFWAAIIVAVVFMYRYLFSFHAEEGNKGWLESIKTWIDHFKSSSHFRSMFFLAFYVMLVLFKTVLNRTMWIYPLKNVFGGWWIWDIDSNGQQVLSTACLENLMLLIPFSILYLGSKVKETKTIVWIAKNSIVASFVLALFIEMVQLVFRIGNFQFSDLVYNTLGGFIGGLIYWIGYKVKHRGSGL